MKTEFIKAQKAIEKIENSECVRSALDAYLNFVKCFGFTSVAVGEISNPALGCETNFIQFSTWPKEWIEYWMENNLYTIDPIAKLALLQNKPFRWNEAMTRMRGFPESAKKAFNSFGFSDGLAIPVRLGSGPPGCVSLGCNELELTHTQRGTIEIVSVHLYAHIVSLLGRDEINEFLELSPRETDVLHFVAAGKTNWEIGTILSVSQNHVRDTLKRASKKLNAVSRAHAVAVAMRENRIFP